MQVAKLINEEWLVFWLKIITVYTTYFEIIVIIKVLEYNAGQH